MVDTIPGEVVDFESISVGAAAVGLTASKLSRASKSNPRGVYVVVESHPLNFRSDGVAATGAVGGGTRKAPGQAFVVWGAPALANLSMIRTDDATAGSVANVSYLV